MQTPNGILPVDKPAGWTSFDVLAKLRGALGTRKLGHSGTLDPMATGVLAVFIGKATSAADRQLDHDKTYEATLRLGLRTDTGDVTGETLETAPVTVGAQELCAVLPQFRGDRMQRPPMYSAVKINGQPLYKAARKGQTVERTPRPTDFVGHAGFKQRLPNHKHSHAEDDIRIDVPGERLFGFKDAGHAQTHGNDRGCQAQRNLFQHEHNDRKCQKAEGDNCGIHWMLPPFYLDI